MGLEIGGEREGEKLLDGVFGKHGGDEVREECRGFVMAEKRGECGGEVEHREGGVEDGPEAGVDLLALRDRGELEGKLGKSSDV